MEWLFQIIICCICFLLGMYWQKKRIFRFSKKNIKKKTDNDDEFEEVYDFDNEDLKMVFLVRKDLKMGVGKIGAQIGHAAVGLCYEIINRKDAYHQQALEYWNQFGAKKVVLSVDSLETMKEVAQKCKLSGIPHIMISDAGHTQIAPGSVTVLGIGVDSSKKINTITVASTSSSFQNELQSVFPYSSEKREDYTDELDENCYCKNIPKDFIARISLIELKMLYQHALESSFSIEDERRPIQPSYNPQDYMISIEAIIIGEDKRTMIAIRNIPKDYSPKALFRELCVDFYEKFNYFFLPYSNQTKTNNGYALINFSHPLHIIAFYDLYHKKYLKHHINKKKLNVFYSKYTFEDQIIVSDAQANNSLIPLRYMKLFKRMYCHSLCIVKERNYSDDGYFFVKLLKKKSSTG